MKSVYTILLIASTLGFILSAGADDRKHKIALFAMPLLTVTLLTVLRENSSW